MNNEQKYLFDLQGYLVLPQVLLPEQVTALNDTCARIEARDPIDYRDAVCLGKERVNGETYISNVVESDEVFEDLIDLAPVVDLIEGTSPGQYRLNHTYMITREGRGYTYMHMGAKPIHPKCMYACDGDQIASTLTKAVFPLAGTNEKDGCFAAIPGSHKSNFVRPFGDHPDENPPLVPIATKPGDVIVFTEALAHGSLVNRSGALRRTLFYCYSVGYMPDWGRLGLQFSDPFLSRLNDTRHEIVRRK